VQVSGWKGKVLGIRIGQENRRRYFIREWKRIEIEIDGQAHIFSLPQGFWGRRPEVQGIEIQNWLIAQGLAPWPKRRTPKVELVPISGQLFRLELTSTIRN
jgi:hypothetical protein